MQRLSGFDVDQSSFTSVCSVHLHSTTELNFLIERPSTDFYQYSLWYLSSKFRSSVPDNVNMIILRLDTSFFLE